MELNKETRQRYQNRILEAMKDQGNAKLNCDFFAKRIGISKEYVLQLMRAMGEQGHLGHGAGRKGDLLLHRWIGRIHEVPQLLTPAASAPPIKKPTWSDT